MSQPSTPSHMPSTPPAGYEQVITDDLYLYAPILPTSLSLRVHPRKDLKFNIVGPQPAEVPMALIKEIVAPSGHIKGVPTDYSQGKKCRLILYRWVAEKKGLPFTELRMDDSQGVGVQ